MNKERIKLNKPYTQLVYEISGRTIKNFIRPKWHRDFREKHISSIGSSLLDKTHFSEPLTVNSTKEGYIIVNGNHRVEAIRRIIKKTPNFSIVCTLTKYDELTNEEELELYEVINNVKPETRTDKLKAFCHEAYIVKTMQRDFPFRVLWHRPHKEERNAVIITKLMDAYINRNDGRVVGGLQTDEMSEKINAMTQEDYEKLEEFGTFFKSIFGEPSKNNQYADYGFFSVILKLYFQEAHVGGIGKEELERRIRDMLIKFPSKIIQLFALGAGYKNIQLVYNDMVDMLNMCRRPGRSRDIFNLVKAIREKDNALVV